MPDVRELLVHAVDDVEADPYLGERVIARAARHRRQRRRLLVVASVVMLVVLASLVVVAPWKSNTDVLEPAAPPSTTATAPDDSALLDGPVGPKVNGQGQPLRILGRAYPIGPARFADGRPATRVVFAVDPTSLGGVNPYAFCVALWSPGTSISTATVEGCPSGAAGGRTTPAVFEGEINSDGGNTRVYGPAALVEVLRTDIVRADVKLAYTSDLAATATPDGGRPPVRKRLPMRIYGIGDRRMPYLLGVFDPVPPGYSTIGTDAWNAAGQQVVGNAEVDGHPNLHGSYCGPDPKSGLTSLPCPK